MTYNRAKTKIQAKEHKKETHYHRTRDIYILEDKWESRNPHMIPRSQTKIVDKTELDA